jgi:hypothetical protein
MYVHSLTGLRAQMILNMEFYKRRLERKDITSNDWIIRCKVVLFGPEELVKGFNKLYLMAVFKE